MADGIRVVSLVGGGQEIRVRETVLHEMGEAAFYAHLTTLGFSATDLHPPTRTRTAPYEWRIKIRRTDE